MLRGGPAARQAFRPGKDTCPTSELVAHRVRDLLMHRTALIKTLWAHMAEFGIIDPSKPSRPRS